MTRGLTWLFAFLVAAVPAAAQQKGDSPPATAADPAGEAAARGAAVEDYERRLQEIAAEVVELRRDLEGVVRDVVDVELGRVFVFVEGPLEAWEAQGLTVTVDGAPVFSRSLVESEREVLRRGLPLELLDLRLAPGEHRVAVGAPGGEATFPVERGTTASWIAAPGEAGPQWRAEP